MYPNKTLTHSALIALLALPLGCSDDFDRQTDELDRTDSNVIRSLDDAFEEYTLDRGTNAWHARKTDCTNHVSGDLPAPSYDEIESGLREFEIPSDFLIDSVYIARATVDVSSYFVHIDGPDGRGFYAANDANKCALVWKPDWSEAKEDIFRHLAAARVIARAHGDLYDGQDLKIAALDQERISDVAHVLREFDQELELSSVVFSCGECESDYHMDRLLAARTRSVSRDDIATASRAAQWLLDSAAHEGDLNARIDELKAFANALQEATELDDDLDVYVEQSTAWASSIAHEFEGANPSGHFDDDISVILSRSYGDHGDNGRYAALKVAEWMLDNLGGE